MSERDQDEEPEAMPSREDVAREFEEYLVGVGSTTVDHLLCD